MNAASVCALSARGALDDAGGCTGGFELCVLLKEASCGEETWLLRIKGNGDFLGMTVRNNIHLAVPQGASACRGCPGSWCPQAGSAWNKCVVVTGFAKAFWGIN